MFHGSNFFTQFVQQNFGRIR